MQYAVALEMKYKRLRYSHTLAQPPSWYLLSDLCETSTDVWCHYAQFSDKNEVSTLTNG